MGNKQTNKQKNPNKKSKQKPKPGRNSKLVAFEVQGFLSIHHHTTFNILCHLCKVCFQKHVPNFPVMIALS